MLIKTFEFDFHSLLTRKIITECDYNLYNYYDISLLSSKKVQNHYFHY